MNSKKGVERRDLIKAAAMGTGASALTGLKVDAAEAAESDELSREMRFTLRRVKG